MADEGIVVVKIGGSTLGSHDTTLEDLVALQRQGTALVVVHGGGATISEWLTVHQVPTRFVRGLRATDADALRVVVAVLAGLINKELVAAINGLGGRALGISGVDGDLVRARRHDPELGYVGEVQAVNSRLLLLMLKEGYLPVVAPLGVGEAGLLNINADTMAGELAQALLARRLIFLTDVPGVKAADGGLLPRLAAEEASAMIAAGAISGGMIPKVEACLRAAAAGAETTIVDGRQPHILLAALGGEAVGSRITG